MNLHRLFCAALLLTAAFSTHAATRPVDYTGIIHNDRDARRATLEVHGRIYELDFGGANLYRAAERYDRERARVVGDLDARYGVIYIDRITFNPYSRPVTYQVDGSYSRDDDYYRSDTSYDSYDRPYWRSERRYYRYR